MTDFQDLILPSVLPSANSNPMPALLYVAAFFCTFLVGLLYTNKHSILAALDAYMYAKYPAISLISNNHQWNSWKSEETSIPAATQDTKSRLPTGSDTRPTLEEKLNGPVTFQPSDSASDSRDRDKPNLDKNFEGKACNIGYPTMEEPATTEQNTSSDNGQERMSSSSENGNIAEEQHETVEQRITGATRSGAEVETPTSPNSPLTGLSRVCASALPATSANEQARFVDARVQPATRSVMVIESENGTVTSEEVHPSPPISPVPYYKIKADDTTKHDTTKRRGRRPRNSTAQSPSRTTAFHADGIQLQQPSPRPSPNANVNLYRPTGGYINPPPGLQFHPHPSTTPGMPGILVPTYPPPPKSAATRMNVQPCHSAPLPPRVPNTMLPCSDNHYRTMPTETTTYQQASDVATRNLPKETPNSPWSPFASGLNIDLGSHPTVNGKHPGHFHQRASSTGSILQNYQGSHNLNGNLNSPRHMQEDNIDKRYGQGTSSASFFSDPSRPNPASSLFVSQPVVALPWMPATQPLVHCRKTSKPGDPYSSRQFSLFDKRLAFSSPQER